MKITKEQVKNWEACIDGYRWFLDKFPEGGDYADIHQGLLNDNRFEDAGWLTEKMYQSFFGTPELPQAEASAGNKMIETLNNMDMPTVESISEWGGQQASSGDGTQQASSGDRTRHSVTGRNPKIATSGIDAEIMAIGDNSVVAAANSVSKIVLGEGGCASIAYHDGERTRFAVAYVGENGIEAGVAYEVSESGEFVKLEGE